MIFEPTGSLIRARTALPDRDGSRSTLPSADHRGEIGWRARPEGPFAPKGATSGRAHQRGSAKPSIRAEEPRLTSASSIVNSSYVMNPIHPFSPVIGTHGQT